MKGEKCTCLAFAVKLVGREIEIAKCSPLFTGEYKEKQKVLIELLQAGGFDITTILPHP